MKENIFVATFSADAIGLIRENGLNIEINHTCISADLDLSHRDVLLRQILGDITASGAGRVIVHGPFTEIFPAAIDPLALDFARQRLNAAYEVAAAIGAEAMVVHSGYAPFFYFKSWQAEKSAVFWQDFLADKPADFRLYIENVLEDAPEMSAEMMRQISDGRIGLCLDTGHALAAARLDARSPRAATSSGAQSAQAANAHLLHWIKVLAPYLRHFHLHNNDGTADAHQSLADGLLDFTQFFQAVSTYCRPDVTFTLEARDAAASVSWLADHGYFR